MIDDLFTYPHRAGYKEKTTSKDAADQIEDSGRAQALRQRCFEALARPATPKELAEQLGEEITSIRPRLTELLLSCLIKRTGERRARQHILVRV